MSDILDINSTKMKQQLLKLGDLENILEDNIKQFNDIDAKKIANKSKLKLMKKYLHEYIFGIPQKIKNKHKAQTSQNVFHSCLHRP